MIFLNPHLKSPQVEKSRIVIHQIVPYERIFKMSTHSNTFIVCNTIPIGTLEMAGLDLQAMLSCLQLTVAFGY